MIPLRQAAIVAAAVGLLAFVASPCRGWSGASRLEAARYARPLLPEDLERQVERHRRLFEAGVAWAGGHRAGLEGLERRIRVEAQGAVRAIETHRPFAEIVERLGRVAGLTAELNDPLAAGGPVAAYAPDYSRYRDGVRGRFAVLFYPADRDLRRPDQLDALLRRAVERSRRFAPEIGREYRRVAPLPGSRAFDDRSTAFGIGSVTFCHAVSDIVAVLRYVWLQAGGTDRGGLVTLARDRLILLSEAARR